MGAIMSSQNNNPIDIESGSEDVRPPWMRVLHRVPQLMREKNKHIYDPAIVSLGPYHHGQPQCSRFEAFKHQVVNVMLKDSQKRLRFCSKIRERIDDVRHFYGGISTDEFDDHSLVEMMVRDACTLLYYMEGSTRTLDELQSVDGDKFNQEKVLILQQLGMFGSYNMLGDILKLDNQIPWWLMKSLIGLAYDDDDDDDNKGKEMVRRFLSYQTFGNYADLRQIPWDENGDDEYNPLHLLECLRLPLLITDKFDKSDLENSVEDETADMAYEIETGNEGVMSPPRPSSFKFKCKWWPRKESSSSRFLHWTQRKRLFRSVTELKAKGIYFKPSSPFLTDMSFDSYHLFGVVRLPILAVSKISEIFLPNIIALEMSPGTPCADTIVTSYLTFMKSMIQSTQDVKLLQEKGIIVSHLDNEETMRMFKEMDTLGIQMMSLHHRIKIRINQHCDNKAKTWIAELINTHFRSPWTAIALLAGIFVLVLTVIQTYYAVNPKSTTPQDNTTSKQLGHW